MSFKYDKTAEVNDKSKHHVKAHGIFANNSYKQPLFQKATQAECYGPIKNLQAALRKADKAGSINKSAAAWSDHRQKFAEIILAQQGAQTTPRIR